MKKVIVLLVIGLIFALAAFIVYYQKREVVQIAPIVETRPEGYFVQISPGGAWDVEKWISSNEMVYTQGGQPFKLRIGDEEWEAIAGNLGWWTCQVYTSQIGYPVPSDGPFMSPNVAILSNSTKVYIIPHKDVTRSFRLWVAVGPMSAEQIRILEHGK